MTFTATGDDGVRVYLNGALLIDRWNSSGTSTVTRSLTDTTYEVRVEHYEKSGSALVKLTW